MTRIAGAKAILVGIAGLALSGCTPDGFMGGEPLPNGRVCEAALSITGTFTPSTPKPADVSGCWAVGTWTFSATVTDPGGCSDTMLLEDQYVMEVTRDAEGENEEYVFVNDPTYERVRMKVTSGGSGLCEGGVEVYSMDGTVIVNLHPNLNADNTLTGQGEYEVYTMDQW